MNASAKWCAMLLATLCLTGCGTMFSANWKKRVESCRQTERVELPDAPDTVQGYVPFAAELVDALAYERRLDEIEWECVEGL